MDLEIFFGDVDIESSSNVDNVLNLIKNKEVCKPY